jgi:hypothetical protein
MERSRKGLLRGLVSRTQRGAERLRPPRRVAAGDNLCLDLGSFHDHRTKSMRRISLLPALVNR